MKICIYGAGAIGGYLGVELTRAGADVSLVARGAHLTAMRASGLRLQIGDEERVIHPRCTDTPAELGVQDIVIICLKAHSVTGVLDRMRPLLGSRTRLVTAVNGIPYWYFYRHGGAHENTTLESIDPGGRQWRELGPERAIGCIVYPATEIVAPGVVKHIYGNQFPLGEPSGEISDDVTRLSELFTAAGMKTPVLDRIRDEIWLKLWGNVCFNPISALTHATLDVICSDPATRALSKAIMLEAQAIAETFGVKFRVDVERRIDGAPKGGRTQDLDAAGSRASTSHGNRSAGHRSAGNGPVDGHSNARARCGADTRCPARKGGRIVRGQYPPCGNQNARFCMIAMP
jgi:2-dehydropantoate 2-reductase